ncbi:fam-a protein [Plasmodium vinckei brucechwatti]|uniref:Fam-a protein n=1 Tax=Plasmodium vinckei brucechwatti TaxID=119398 RepID=A0A6V7RVL1_PLAVN|nr:fam-a protein [Plasmodium vinckei brucechwatti]
MLKMNKFYVQIALFLLIIFAYANNETLATEPAPGTDTKPKPRNLFATSEQIFGKNVHLLCHNREETKNADKLMKEAVAYLKHHATNVDGYKLHDIDHEHNMLYYKKIYKGHLTIYKIKYTVDLDKYESTIHELWDPDIINLVDNIPVKTKIVRAYCPNLVMIQQRYKDSIFGRDKYLHALATKVQISKDVTIIAMTSANIIDHHPSDKEYKNKIVKKANLFTTEIDSEDDIRKGELKKTFIHLAGYYIQKHNDHVDVTFIASMDGRSFC